jgi:hypothetical protein
MGNWPKLFQTASLAVLGVRMCLNPARWEDGINVINVCRSEGPVDCPWARPPCEERRNE